MRIIQFPVPGRKGQRGEHESVRWEFKAFFLDFGINYLVFVCDTVCWCVCVLGGWVGGGPRVGLLSFFS